MLIAHPSQLQERALRLLVQVLQALVEMKPSLQSFLHLQSFQVSQQFLLELWFNFFTRIEAPPKMYISLMLYLQTLFETLFLYATCKRIIVSFE